MGLVYSCLKDTCLIVKNRIIGKKNYSENRDQEMHMMADYQDTNMLHNAIFQKKKLLQNREKLTTLDAIEDNQKNISRNIELDFQKDGNNNKSIVIIEELQQWRNHQQIFSERQSQKEDQNNKMITHSKSLNDTTYVDYNQLDILDKLIVKSSKKKNEIQNHQSQKIIKIDDKLTVKSLTNNYVYDTKDLIIDLQVKTPQKNGLNKNNDSSSQSIFKSAVVDDEQSNQKKFLQQNDDIPGDYLDLNKIDSQSFVKKKHRDSFQSPVSPSTNFFVMETKSQNNLDQSEDFWSLNSFNTFTTSKSNKSIQNKLQYKVLQNNCLIGYENSTFFKIYQKINFLIDDDLQNEITQQFHKNIQFVIPQLQESFDLYSDSQFRSQFNLGLQQQFQNIFYLTGQYFVENSSQNQQNLVQFFNNLESYLNIFDLDDIKLIQKGKFQFLYLQQQQKFVKQITFTNDDPQVIYEESIFNIEPNSSNKYFQNTTMEQFSQTMLRVNILIYLQENTYTSISLVKFKFSEQIKAYFQQLNKFIN